MAAFLTPDESRAAATLILSRVKACPFRMEFTKSELNALARACPTCSLARCSAGYGVGGIVTVAECSRCVLKGRAPGER